jgi:flagellar motor protein MotB
VDTVALRLAKYERRLRLQTTLGAAAAAGLGVFTAVKLSEGSSAAAPALWLGPTLLTVAICAGFCLFFPRGAIEYQIDLIKRNLATNDGGSAPVDAAPLRSTMSMAEARPLVAGLTENWPSGARVWYFVALALLAIGALLLLFYVWTPLLQRVLGRTEPPQAEVVGLPLSVHFEVNRTDVPTSLRPPLEDLARRLRKRADIKLLLEGHTDPDGSNDYNLELSRLRAESVKAILVEAGFDTRQIQVAGYGKTQAEGVSVSAAGKAQNRRVDVKLMVEHPASGK